MSKEDSTNSLEKDLTAYLKQKKKLVKEAFKNAGSHKQSALTLSRYFDEYIAYNGIPIRRDGTIFFAFPYAQYLHFSGLKKWNQTVNKYLRGYGYFLRKNKTVIEVTKVL